ncbi:hypothetical protein ACFQL9_13195 [Halobaculum lipolyticum]|uniref:PD-(D/E)XK nuclease superfamily protein n=1 Tax=Halobaculum lipolyticum TaxID=3032001 RepID=A0ABD5WCB5_9EURY
MGSPKRDFFQYIDGEESQTDFFVSLLAQTDTARVLNAIHDELEFDDSAFVRATQRDGLPHHPDENDTRRTIDWVVEDKTKLVGYESKTGTDSLSAEQLQEERQKLEHNTGTKEVYLFGITEEVHEPAFAADASWLSWFDVGASVIGIENKSEAIEIMSDLFKHKGYEEFTGFAPFNRDEAWLITHQNDAVDFAFAVDAHAEEVSLYTDGRKNTDFFNRAKTNLKDVHQNDYQSLGPSYYGFAYQPNEYFDDVVLQYNTTELGWYLSIVVPALHNKVYVQLNTYLSKDKRAREFFVEYSKEIAQLIDHHDMALHASANSLFAERTPTVHRDPDEIAPLIEDRGGEGSFKRFRIGWEVGTDQSPGDIVAEATEKIEELHEIFYDGVERRSEYSEGV